MPVMVTVKVPVVALVPADRVSVALAVAGFVLNAAVVPLRRPEAVSDTLPEKPFDGVMTMVALPLLPRAIPRLGGEAVRLKLGAAVTVRETVVEAAKLPLTPLMVTVKVPNLALSVVVKVSELLVVALAGLKFALTPIGKPAADRPTFPVKLLAGMTVIVMAPPVVPWVTVAVPEEADRVKLPCGGAAAGQLFTRLAALTVPMPVAKSQPVEVP